MNNVTMLTSALEEQPHNTILVSMLVDALVEEKDMVYEEARTKVFEVQRASVEGKHLVEAIRRYRDVSRCQRALNNHVRRRCRILSIEQFALIFIPGSAEPQAQWFTTFHPVAASSRIVVTVGADWCLSHPWYRA